MGKSLDMNFHVCEFVINVFTHWTVLFMSVLKSVCLFVLMGVSFYSFSV